jgi:hypothetical protein
MAAEDPAMSDQGQQPPRNPSFEQRMDRFAHEAGEAGERIGRQAEAAGKRLAANPGVAQATDTAARAWGLLLIVVGAWFFAQFTLGMDLPAVPWREAWPLGLIVLGLIVIVRGMSRRGA